MTDATPGRRADDESARRSVVAVWRIESARIVATLTRMVGDFGLAEDLAQDALVDALAQWPVDGVPKNPGAWLTAVAKRKAIDGWRRRERYDDRLAAIAHDLADEQQRAADAPPWDPDAIDDDVLRLVFVACHPVLSREARVALTLRVVGGLTTEEIARAFLVPTSTVQQRIVRAKKALADAGVGFEVPDREEFPQRLGTVLGVLYLIFNEGYAASSGDDWMRPELSREALRLARVLAGLVPREPEVHGLVALMELTAARFPARLDRDGEPILLADQDRTRWDRSAITRGRTALQRADALGRGRGPYALQAAIAEQHDVAASVDDTDWNAIVAIYDALLRLAPSPVVELNRAVAVSMASGAAAGLDLVDALAGDRRLALSHLLPSVRGELLARLGRDDEARAEFEQAADRTENARERAVLLAKATARR
ncbi:sigma-70 family RNA polymerase sigma factor [Agromyces sp. CFH 90414]|uniref:RNA polymerase sigma factor n=1 Tax=Agromyces agglutinans TaxID=2662258 RepID=A0A6I2F9D5_9MICO|nr:RNA polymerase sigma factor [Agromyces agglutinans]MRG61249.1 sigma-70 family RNA polymerase sigma factor [Agromyces agglutinans]